MQKVVGSNPISRFSEGGCECRGQARVQGSMMEGATVEQAAPANERASRVFGVRRSYALYRDAKRRLMGRAQNAGLRRGRPVGGRSQSDATGYEPRR